MLNFLGLNWTMLPSLRPQVSVSISLLNLQQIILTFSTRFCCLLDNRVDLSSRSCTNLNSLVLMNSIKVIILNGNYILS